MDKNQVAGFFNVDFLLFGEKKHFKLTSLMKKIVSFFFGYFSLGSIFSIEIEKKITNVTF